LINEKFKGTGVWLGFLVGGKGLKQITAQTDTSFVPVSRKVSRLFGTTAEKKSEKNGQNSDECYLAVNLGKNNV